MAHGAAGWGPETRPGRTAPDLWPLAVLVLSLAFGVMLLAADWESDAWGISAGVLAAALGTAIGLWMRQRVRASRAPAYIPPPPKLSWTLAFTIPAKATGDATAEGAFIAAIEGLVGQQIETLTSARILVSPGSSGPRQAIIETVWSEAGPEQDSLDADIERLLAAHPDLVVSGSVFRLAGEVVRDKHEQAVRLPIAMVAGGVAVMGVIGLGLGALLAAFQEPGSAAAPVDGGPAAVPDAFDGVIIEKGIRFITDEFQLPPNTEVTLTEDNQDPSVPHNMHFFAGPDVGGADLAGCASGCDGPGVMTPVSVGPSTHAFTFTTPGVGTYAFRCDVHPTTMTGVMTIVEGAPAPPP